MTVVIPVTVRVGHGKSDFLLVTRHFNVHHVQDRPRTVNDVHRNRCIVVTDTTGSTTPSVVVTLVKTSTTPTTPLNSTTTTNGWNSLPTYLMGTGFGDGD